LARFRRHVKVARHPLSWPAFIDDVLDLETIAVHGARHADVRFARCGILAQRATQLFDPLIAELLPLFARLDLAPLLPIALVDLVAPTTDVALDHPDRLGPLFLAEHLGGDLAQVHGLISGAEPCQTDQHNTQGQEAEVPTKGRIHDAVSQEWPRHQCSWCPGRGPSAESARSRAGKGGLR